MKNMWCWRCQMDIPMLDDVEFEGWAKIFQACRRAVKQERRATGKSLNEIDSKKRYQPALDEYERLTGFKETNALAIWHHRISLYGPPCKNCGKPLRTKVASFCAECGQTVSRTE